MKRSDQIEQAERRALSALDLAADTASKVATSYNPEEKADLARAAESLSKHAYNMLRSLKLLRGTP